MIPLRLREIAELVDGRLVGDGDVVVDGPVVVDSREVGPGGLFVAMVGERVDGHDFVDQATAAGAAAVLVQRELGADAATPHVVVDEPVAALGHLARAVRARLPETRVVAITGSSGKTSTKDLISQVLGTSGPVVSPAGSLNNEIGMPLTVLQADEATRYLVLEMGARGIGHVEYLTSLVPPDVGVVLNVGTAHLGEFGSRDAIAVAKGEMVEALRPDGYAVLNTDDPLVWGMRDRTVAAVVGFGESAAADVRARDVNVDTTGRPSFVLDLPGSLGHAVALQVHGEHQVSNALAAAAAAHALGLEGTQVAQALTAAVPRSRWRMEVTRRPDGVTVVNDAYNANPDSVRAALKALVSMAGEGRSWAVLGEMGELGSDSTTEHDGIGRLAVRLNVDRLVVVGEGARPVHLGAAHEGSWGQESAWVPDADAAVAMLSQQLRPGDVVLVKASRSVGLESVAEQLLRDAGAPETEEHR
jgi:UDP-N-acetylmuramoyl-tripeptide--D-alanyl-D-alanine ligase